jgi:hypothetical protein
LNERDKIRVVFFHDSLDRPISIPFVTKSTLSPENLLSNFEHVAQSYKTVKLNESNSLKATVVIARLPSGGGRSRKNNKNLHQQENNLSELELYYLKKKSIKIVYNQDNLCALRAILIGQAYADGDKNAYKLARIGSSILEKKTILVANKLKLDQKMRCGIEEIKLIESFLREYQITVVKLDGKIDNEPVYIGQPNKKFIYLTYDDNKKHYNTITSMKAFFNRGYYCDFCKVAYNNLEKHYCQYTCNGCKRFKCYESLKLKCIYCKKEC